MAIDTTIAPFISNMLRQPSADTARGLTDAFDAFSSAFVAARDQKRADEQAAYEKDPEGAPMPSDPTGAEKLFRSYNESRNPNLKTIGLQQRLLQSQVNRSEMETKSMNQIMGMNPIEFSKKAGEIPPEDIPRFVQEHSALAASPWGSKMLGMMLDAYNANVDTKVRAKEAEAKADMALAGVDIQDAEAVADFRKQRTVTSTMNDLFSMAAKSGRDPATLSNFDASMLDERGGWKDKSTPFTLLQSMGKKDQPLTELGKLMQEKNAATLRGDKEAATTIQAAIDKHIAPTGMQITHNADGSFTMTQGPLNTTTGSATKSQEKIKTIEKTIQDSDSVLKNLRPEDVGIKGFLGNKLMDNVLPQFGLSTADVERIRNRQDVGYLGETSLKAIASGDKNFSDRDRKFASDLVVGLNPLKSYEDAITLTENFKRIKAKEALIEFKNLHQPPTATVLGALDDVALVEAETTGLLTKEQAARELNSPARVERRNKNRRAR